MVEKDLGTEAGAGLERLCGRDGRSLIALASSLPGIERMEARFHGRLFTPHRHDTYALGVTLQGVQAFTYRGSRRISTPGHVIVLHPDEVHDGAAETDDGLRYRMLYLDPSLLQRGLGGASLPFVKEPVLSDDTLLDILLPALDPLDETLDELLVDDLMTRLAACLSRHAGSRPRRLRTPALSACRLAHDYLMDNAMRPVRSRELEDVTGLDRFELSRHFRSAFATSPYRFLLMRRLERARSLVAGGWPLADVAVDTGFADQSHLTRHFKKAYGLTPGRWAALTEASRARAKTAGTGGQWPCVGPSLTHSSFGRTNTMEDPNVICRRLHCRRAEKEHRGIQGDGPAR